jgi:hypothetical protein
VPMLPVKDYKPTPTRQTRREARTVTEDIVFSSQQKLWSFRRSLEFIAGLLFPLLALSVAVPALAAQVVRHELPEVNEGDH